ncbi:MAG: GNAT family N-acetyltransferase [Chloroflexota bacterium]|nr:GNAT family N-acetyltransferase [Chloroflexota bacterium]
MRVRPVRADDAEALHRIRLRPSVVRYTMALPSTRVEDMRRRIEGAGPDDHLFVAELDGQVVGMAGLHVRGSKQRHVADLGIMVDDEHQGRGIGRALMAALLDIADYHLGLARVELEVVADNPAAIHLYESLGFEREGLKRRAFLVDGRLADLVVMGRLRGHAAARPE